MRVVSSAVTDAEFVPCVRPEKVGLDEFVRPDPILGSLLWFCWRVNDPERLFQQETISLQDLA